MLNSNVVNLQIMTRRCLSRGLDALHLRSSLERALRGRVVRRRIPAPFGGRKIYASPEASLIWALPGAATVDLELTDFCREFVTPGSVVWDIGANVGLFSFCAAHASGKNGRVIALEPDPFLAALIQRSESERPETAAPCTVLAMAVGRQSGFAAFEIAERSRASNAMVGKSHCTQRGGVRTTLDVPLTTLDTLASHYPSPDIIKIDVEGAEADCLAGGAAVLRKARPVLYIEVQSNNAASIVQILADLDYALFDPSVSKDLRVELKEPTYNVLAVPR